MSDAITPAPTDATSASEPDADAEVRAEAARAERDLRCSLRLIPTPAHWVLLAVALVGYVVFPLVLSDLWAAVFVYAGILAIAGLGLNLLTGVGGQASLGTAAFIAIGAFCASYLGRATDLNPAGKGLPFLVYFVAAIIVGGAVGFVVGLPALRLRGPYLVIVTLGLVYATAYVLARWDFISNGGSGVPAPVSLKIGAIDFKAFDLFGLRDTPLGTQQSLSYLVWLVVGITALLVRNVVRSRPGRALQAIRDRDVAAEVVGISLFRYKIGAFVMSSAIGAMAGVFFAHYISYIQADTKMFGLALSVAVLSVVVVGGVGSMSGTIVGALIIASLPTLVREYGTDLPFVTTANVTAYGDIVVAALLVITLVTQPGGIAALVTKVWNTVMPTTPSPGLTPAASTGAGSIEDKDSEPSIE